MSRPPELGTVLAALSGPPGMHHFGEVVPLVEHSLQCATLAEGAGASPEMVVAALLHDIGWLSERDSTDDSHEELGAGLLSSFFGPRVVEPVRLHVLAKRYLCTIDSSYAEGLSGSSTATLTEQGGLLDTHDLEEFLSSPWHDDAVALRRFDDQAKVPGRRTLTWDRFEALAVSLSRS